MTGDEVVNILVDVVFCSRVVFANVVVGLTVAILFAMVCLTVFVVREVTNGEDVNKVVNFLVATYVVCISRIVCANVDVGVVLEVVSTVVRIYVNSEEQMMQLLNY